MQNKFERYLIEQCAPTLAGIKVGNLFRYTTADNEDINDILSFWNNILTEKGVRLYLMKEKSSGGLIYVFRPDLLSKLLSDKNINLFLNNRGYAKCHNPDTYIRQLQCHFYNSSSFPHEIGIFLGYPLHDVQGFIDNKGKNFRLCGSWKVYGEQHLAEKLFARYRRCVDIYKTKFENGTDILKLTITA